MNSTETLIPHVGVVTDIRQDTPDVKTFRVVSPEGGKVFEHMPGQCAMLSIPGVGEGMYRVSEKGCSPLRLRRPMKHSWNSASKSAAASRHGSMLWM